MAKTVTISHSTSKDIVTTKRSLDEVFEDLKSRYNIEGSWESDKLFVLSGPGLEGSVSIMDSTVQIDLSLGLLLGSFSEIIEHNIKKELEEKLP